MKVSKVWKTVLAAALILSIAGAGLWVKKIPLFQETIFYQQKNSKPLERDLQKENEELKAKVAELQQALSMKANDSEKAAEKNSDPPKTDPVEQKKIYRELADYYTNMKPTAAVAILKNQDSQMVAGILHEMEKEQAGEILSALDPAQAAKLIELIAEIS